MRQFWCLGRFVVVVAIAGCGDSDGGEGDETGGSSMGSTQTTGAMTSDSGTTTGGTGVTSECRVGCCNLCPDSSCGDSPDGCTTSSDDTTGTTGASACVGLAQSECSMTPGCLPLGAGLVVEDGQGGFCSEPPAFVECVDEQACGAAITYVCPPDRTDVYVVSSTCIPTGWTVCRPPADSTPVCQ